MDSRHAHSQPRLHERWDGPMRPVVDAIGDGLAALLGHAVVIVADGED
ncbi:hypothetical protein [Streptomyces decoyicus]